MLEHFHRLGIPVHVWTVDDEDEMRALLASAWTGSSPTAPTCSRACSAA